MNIIEFSWLTKLSSLTHSLTDDWLTDDGAQTRPDQTPRSNDDVSCVSYLLLLLSFTRKDYNIKVARVDIIMAE